MTPVGGFAALVVDRSQSHNRRPPVRTAIFELLAEDLNWARRENPQIVAPTSARGGRSEDPRLLDARSSDAPALSGGDFLASMVPTTDRSAIRAETAAGSRSVEPSRALRMLAE